MVNSSEEKNKEINDTKEFVKQMNVDAVANMLIKIQDDNYNIKSEFINLKKMITKVIEDIKELKNQANELKAIGARGTIGGTGSTVHKKNE